MRLYVMVCVLAACWQAYGSQQAIVQFTSGAVTGSVTFTKVSNTTVRVVAEMNGLQAPQRWNIRKLPVDQTVNPANQCQDSWLGLNFDPNRTSTSTGQLNDCSADVYQCVVGDLTGRLGMLPASGQLDARDTTGHIRLEGMNSIVGRSLVIETSPVRVCGTILIQEEVKGANVVILQAIFVSPIAGRMYMKQVEGKRDVQMWGKVFWVNDSMTSTEHNWHIHVDIPADYRVGKCADALGHYDPLDQGPTDAANYTNRCSTTMLEGCEIGDLTAKLGTINVAATPAPHYNEAFFFTDTYLNLTGVNAVINRSIVIHIAGRGAPRVACAPLVEVENVTLMAAAREDRASYVSVSQYSRFQDTVISIGNLPSTNVPSDLGSDNSDLTVVTATLNPNTPCPLDGTTTPTSDSTYSPYDNGLGDVSGRYSNNVRADNSFAIRNLPLSGAMTTISGRTLRYTYGKSRECAALLPMLRGSQIVTAKAAFADGPIGGAIYFVQRRTSDVLSDATVIIVDIYYSNASMAETTGHNWHIHQNPPQSGQACAGTIGGHYNPFSVSLGNTIAETDPSMNSNYSADCSPAYQLRCESGDLSGKHGQLTISPPSNSRVTFAYTDNNLELGGNFSILGRSVGLHLPSSEGGALFACAAIRQGAVSASVITTSVPEEESTTRLALIQELARNLTTPDNLLVVNQYVTSSCVSTTMRALGSTQAAADTLAASVRERASRQYNSCPSSAAAPSSSPLLPLLFLLLLLLSTLLI